MKHLMKASLIALLGIAGLTPAVVQAQSSASDYTSATRFDATGRVVGTIAPDPDGAGPLKHAATRTTYDTRGNVIKVETGELQSGKDESIDPANWGTDFDNHIHTTLETTYDALNRKLTDKVSGVASAGATPVAVSLTQYSYDAAGRLECTAVRMNPAVYNSLPASACTLGTAGSQGPDRITRTIYDDAGQVLQVRKAVGTPIEIAYATYSYTDSGQMEQMVDANGNRAEMRYDGHDRQDRWTFPSETRPTAFDGATHTSAMASAGAINPSDYEEYTYDASGNRLTLRKRDGSVLDYEYDNLNRMTRKTVPSRAGLGSTHTRDVFYSYDLQGLPLRSRFDSINGAGQTNTYDGFGRLTQTTDNTAGTGRTLSYQYDKNGNRTRVDYLPVGFDFRYDYDGLNRLTNLRQSGTILGTVSYSERGLPSRRDWTSSAYSNETDWGYDAAGRLNSLSIDLQSFGNDVTWSYTRNPASQILTEAQSNDNYSWNGHVNVARNYTTNGLNQYESAGTAAFCYDANGNLTADGSSVYLYDVENRLVEKRDQGTGNTNCAALSYAGTLQAQLRYDPLGRLFEVTGGALGTQVFLHDGNALAIEFDAIGNAQRFFVHGSNDEADDPLVWFERPLSGSGWARRFMHADPRGSIVALTRSDGVSIGRNTYDEFGIPDSASGNDIATKGRFRYTGQVWLPELGMYYYKARIYSPTLGRFLQTDPIGYEDQVNLYAYVGNDPINSVDPTGMLERGGTLQHANTWNARSGGTFMQRDVGGTVNQSRPATAPSSTGGRPGQSGGWAEVWANLIPPVRLAELLDEVLDAIVPEPERIAVQAFRVYGAPGQEFGRYWTPFNPEQYESEEAMRQALALDPEWNAATHVAVATIMQDNILREGPVTPETVNGVTYTGGGYEILVRNPWAVHIHERRPLTFGR